MTERPVSLPALKRPQLLVRAARHGMDDYRRDRVLPRLLGDHRRLGAQAALERLIEAEASAERDRRDGAATYSVTGHVELLIALMSEARLLARRATA